MKPAALIFSTGLILWSLLTLINAVLTWRRRRAADPLRGRYRRALLALQAEHRARLDTVVGQRFQPVSETSPAGDHPSGNAQCKGRPGLPRRRAPHRH